MNVSPKTLLAELADIRGLDFIGWWPLAPGWWVLLALVISAAALLYWRRRAYRLSWKGDASRTLEVLKAQLAEDNAQDIAATLSVLLRRVAMRRFSRPECAGLQGQDWLRWLSAKDPKGFDWAGFGILLIEVPYAPPGRNVSRETLNILIDATKMWVR